MRRRSRAIYITPSSRPWWPKQILQAMAGLAPARPPRATGRSWAGAHQVLGVQSVVVAPPRLDARRAAEEQGHHPAQELVRQRHQADEGGALGQRPGAGVEDGKTKGCLQRAAQLLRHCRAEGRRRALNMSTKCWDYGAGSAREAAGRVGTSKTDRQAPHVVRPAGPRSQVQYFGALGIRPRISATQGCRGAPHCAPMSRRRPRASPPRRCCPLAGAASAWQPPRWRLSTLMRREASTHSSAQPRRRCRFRTSRGLGRAEAQWAATFIGAAACPRRASF